MNEKEQQEKKLLDDVNKLIKTKPQKFNSCSLVNGSNCCSFSSNDESHQTLLKNALNYFEKVDNSRAYIG